MSERKTEEFFVGDIVCFNDSAINVSDYPHLIGEQVRVTEVRWMSMPSIRHGFRINYLVDVEHIEDGYFHSGLYPIRFSHITAGRPAWEV